jgi:lipopolysaccharide transport system permease protein
VCVALFDYLLTLPILLVAIFVTVGVSPWMLMLPLVLAVQLCLTIGLACLVAPLNVLFRDVGHLLGLVLLLGFFITPVFYSLEQVPARFSLAYDLNPMAQLIEAQRTIFIEQAMPEFGSLGLTALGASIVLGVGLMVFRRLTHTIPDYM